MKFRIPSAAPKRLRGLEARVPIKFGIKRPKLSLPSGNKMKLKLKF